MNTLTIILALLCAACAVTAAVFYARSISESHLLDERQILLEETSKDLEKSRKELLESRLECSRLETENLHLNKSREEDESRRAKDFEQQICFIKERLEKEMYELLERKTKNLNESNSESITSILKPYQESLKQMREAIESARDTSNRNASSVGEMVKQMMQKTDVMNSNAEDLVRVFRRENKIVGNWGESVLESLLERSGLVIGEHYLLQTMLKDASDVALKNESNRKMIPDAIIHYPDGKDMYVDSKVSLTAFMEYKNAETDEARAQAMKRHVDSVKAHVLELEKADYVSYGNKQRRPLDCVMMFMPMDAAMQAALSAEPSLWNWAFEKKIFITSEQNLILALKMVKVAWTQQIQIQNQEKVYAIAGNLLDRIADFGRELEAIGTKLEEATDKYRSTKEKLLTGKQSIAVSARQLQALGAKAKPAKQELLESAISEASEE